MFFNTFGEHFVNFKSFYFLRINRIISIGNFVSFHFPLLIIVKKLLFPIFNNFFLILIFFDRNLLVSLNLILDFFLSHIFFHFGLSFILFFFLSSFKIKLEKFFFVFEPFPFLIFLKFPIFFVYDFSAFF